MRAVRVTRFVAAVILFTVAGVGFLILGPAIRAGYMGGAGNDHGRESQCNLGPAVAQIRMSLYGATSRSAVTRALLASGKREYKIQGTVVTVGADRTAHKVVVAQPGVCSADIQLP